MLPFPQQQILELVLYYEYDQSFQSRKGRETDLPKNPELLISNKTTDPSPTDTLEILSQIASEQEKFKWVQA